MTDYKGIKGIPIETIAGDPSNPLVGQVWYNSTSNDLKCYKYEIGTGAWSSGTASPEAHVSGAGVGTQTAYIAIGSAPGNTGNESYNGTSWTQANDLVTKRPSNTGTFGTTAAGLTSGGPANLVEIYDGTCWSETANLTRTTGTTQQGGTGTTTAGLIFAGNPGNVVLTETWNGTSWSETNDSNDGSHGCFSIGTQTAALQAGGNAPPRPAPTYLATTETWDGTSWTEVADLNTARGKGGQSGTQTAGMVAAGNNAVNPAQDETEMWDGTSWTEVADVGSARYACFGTPSGSSLASLITGGFALSQPPPYFTMLEEWNDPTGNVVKTFTDS